MLSQVDYGCYLLEWWPATWVEICCFVGRFRGLGSPHLFNHEAFLLCYGSYQDIQNWMVETILCKVSQWNLLAKTPKRKAPKDERVAAHSTMQCPMAIRSLIGAVGRQNLLADLPATASNESSNIRFCWRISGAQTTKKATWKGSNLQNWINLICYTGILNNQPLSNFILDVTWIRPK